MRVLVESFLIYMLLVFIFFVSLEYVIMNKQIITAREFHSACVDNIENAAFDTNTIKAWEENAQKNGFNLLVKSVDGANILSPCYYVEVTYNTGIRLLGVSGEGVIQGYAR
ncbi:hypothetical protein [Parasporobacterium paucivorans]|uniref:TadE-like protein n=1 Tax=Parasporobacterium paucivorans DSM 15970 TaxID=1122934 RepID=A0A1M6FVI3_9FIRM|nr:hypothetical protein [Parasporobacterium paucivorans]SHJ01751.1 hypothetical protein SAMN02745691_01214 [Parasporobacterium paucivorans DSM 15970]